MSLDKGFSLSVPFFSSKKCGLSVFYATITHMFCGSDNSSTFVIFDVKNLNFFQLKKKKYRISRWDLNYSLSRILKRSFLSFLSKTRTIIQYVINELKIGDYQEGYLFTNLSSLLNKN